jgi:hypothetical protein
MGLDMKDKERICGQIAKLYQKTGKNDKGKILDEYTETLGYNRDYIAHILSNCGGLPRKPVYYHFVGAAKFNRPKGRGIRPRRE